MFPIFPKGPAEIPRDCAIRNTNETGAYVDCAETYDGGSRPHYWIQWQDGAGHFQTLVNVSVPDFSVYSLDSGFNYSVRVCASNEEFWSSVSCSQAFSVLTTAVGKKKNNVWIILEGDMYDNLKFIEIHLLIPLLENMTGYSTTQGQLH